jgi:hypothetical protein
VKTVPTATPSTIARSEVMNEAPRAAPSMPVASVVTFAFDMNHNGKRLQGLPRRSLSGTQSMDRDSISVRSIGSRRSLVDWLMALLESRRWATLG